jgi:hypothetical protein
MFSGSILSPNLLKEERILFQSVLFRSLYNWRIDTSEYLLLDSNPLRPFLKLEGRLSN